MKSGEPLSDDGAFPSLISGQETLPIVGYLYGFGYKVRGAIAPRTDVGNHIRPRPACHTDLETFGAKQNRHRCAGLGFMFFDDPFRQTVERGTFSAVENFCSRKLNAFVELLL